MDEDRLQRIETKLDLLLGFLEHWRPMLERLTDNPIVRMKMGKKAH
jgi:hypothetical protein